MNRTVELFASERCDYGLRPLPPDPIRTALGPYLRPFTAPALRYRVSGRACLAGEPMVGLEGWRRRVIAETLPFQSPGLAERFAIPKLQPAALQRLRRRSWLPARTRLEGAICSLIDLCGWQGSYFHWFIDALPRVLAAEDHQRRSGRSVRLLVPHNLRNWQRDSLTLLGWSQERLIPFRAVDNHRHLVVGELISCCVRGSGQAVDAPVDALVPAVIRCLRQRFDRAVPPESADALPRRLYISRGDAPTRRVVNEEEVMEVLGRHGFVRIRLAGLNLIEQIRLFRAATHIVAPHGAGLTNLLHARQASVLEVFQPRHGVRAEFMEIAAALDLPYDARLGCVIDDEGDDIRIDPQGLRSWRDLPA